MPDARLQRRFRILLHLLRRMEAPGSHEAGLEEDPCEPAIHRISHPSDWLAHETQLLEVAVRATLNLERHLDSLGEPVPSRREGAKEAWNHLDEVQVVRLASLQNALLAAFLQYEAQGKPSVGWQPSPG